MKLRLVKKTFSDSEKEFLEKTEKNGLTAELKMQIENEYRRLRQKELLTDSDAIGTIQERFQRKLTNAQIFNLLRLV